MKKATIFDIAKYILQKKGEMTTMKLQRLCYYAQVWSLAWNEVPLFDEDFEAWSNGPVCPQLFAKHKGTFLVNASLFKDREDYPFGESQIETLDSVIEYYGDREPWWLNELTHLEFPWKNARSGIPNGEPCSNIIEKESMQLYYAGLQEN